MKSTEKLLEELFAYHRAGQHAKLNESCFYCRKEQEYRAPKETPAGRRSKKRNKGAKSTKAWIRTMRLRHCHYCGDPGGTIDHMVPVSQGGRTIKDNCVPCCEPCNKFKSDKFTYEQFKSGMWKNRPFIGSKMALGGSLVQSIPI